MSGTSRWVIRDDLGKWVTAHSAEGLTRQGAIDVFCFPALEWSGFEAAGWTCKLEPADQPLGPPSLANMEVDDD